MNKRHLWQSVSKPAMHFFRTPFGPREYDRLLWTFSQLSFVPHVKAGHPLAAETPIVIANDDSGLTHHDSLLNIGDDPPPFFSRFDALREVVSCDENDVMRARERFRFYKSRGFDVQKQDMLANG